MQGPGLPPPTGYRTAVSSFDMDGPVQQPPTGLSLPSKYRTPPFPGRRRVAEMVFHSYSSESRYGLSADSYQPRKRVSKFDDPSTTNPPLSRFIVPPVPGIGGDDRFPGPGAGVYPTRGDGGSGSMLVGPNDRRFFGGVGREPRMPGGLPGVVPSGARFDPYGPPDVPGFEPHRFVRDPRRPGRGTHPDLEHFGNDSDFKTIEQSIREIKIE